MHLTVDEFDLVLTGMQRYKNNLLNNTKVKYITFENKILLVIQWIDKYEHYAELSIKFGISEFQVSMIKSETLKYLVAYFITFIPNTRTSDYTSSMSSTWCDFIVAGLKINQLKSDNHRVRFNWKS